MAVTVSAVTRPSASAAWIRSVPTGSATADDTEAALEFYKTLFDAREERRVPGESGKLMHSELFFAGGVIHVNDDFAPQSAAPAMTALFIGCDKAAEVDALDDVAALIGAAEASASGSSYSPAGNLIGSLGSSQLASRPRRKPRKNDPTGDDFVRELLMRSRN